MASVGSCCLIGAITGDRLYVANLGDSRAVLGRTSLGGRAVVAERLSTDHNVSVEEVRNEVAACHPNDKQIIVHTRGAWRIKGIIQVRRLSVSRSIGDIYLKKPEFSSDPLFQQFVSPVRLERPVITAEPSIRVHNLKPHDLFFIFASDGLWEQLSDEAAVKIVFKNPRAVSFLAPSVLACFLIVLYFLAFLRQHHAFDVNIRCSLLKLIQGIAKRLVRAALIEAARKQGMSYDDLKHIEKGIRRHFHDDITVIVIYIDQHNQGGHSSFNHRNHDCTSAPVDIFSFNVDESEDPLRRV
ncbi:hypothetical protein BHM03_00011798 [Ensete ventricosum]|nr:hypothetical protein BHM03_00011798 [Ensete ventricosum]